MYFYKILTFILYRVFEIVFQITYFVFSFSAAGIIVSS